MATVGLIARACNSGLGTCSWEMANHIKFDQIQLVKRKYEWFPERFYNVVDNLTTDIVVAIETPYEWEVFRNRRSVLVPMYECTNYPFPVAPSKVIAPSLLDAKFYEGSTYLPFPINRNVLPFKKRERANVFVHNTGHGGLGSRNGTKDLLDAMEFVKSDIKLIINTQIPFTTNDPRVVVKIHDAKNYWENWGEGDVFIFPEKFNGLSLPIQEAMSVGMPIMSTDRYPFNAFLPRELLIPVGRYERKRISTTFQSAVLDPKTIAKKIDEWAGKDIGAYSQQMDETAQMMSWDRLADKWKSEILSA
jgi:glycosyltransferase involved in cell wall biosynthesis